MNEDELIRRIHGLQCTDWNDSDSDSERDYDDEYKALKPPAVPLRILQADIVKVEPFKVVTYKKINIKKLCDKRRKANSKRNKQSKITVNQLKEQEKAASENKNIPSLEDNNGRQRSPSSTLGDFVKVMPQNIKRKRPKRKHSSNSGNLAGGETAELVTTPIIHSPSIKDTKNCNTLINLKSINKRDLQNNLLTNPGL